jgi:hypothetical protein
MVGLGTMGALPDVDGAETEVHRRHLLAESDELLGWVEELRLQDRRTVPDQLREAIGQLQRRLGRREPPPTPASVRAAHDLVFAVQQRLMAANPRNPSPRSHPGRPSGQPATTAVRGGGQWKFLTLPPAPGPASAVSWEELIEATVQRAWDRWAYAQHHALRAARDKEVLGLAAAMQRAAWTNYWQLREEAERMHAPLRLNLMPGGTTRAGPAARSR